MPNKYKRIGTYQTKTGSLYLNGVGIGNGGEQEGVFNIYYRGDVASMPSVLERLNFVTCTLPRITHLDFLFNEDDGSICAVDLPEVGNGDRLAFYNDGKGNIYIEIWRR